MKRQEEAKTPTGERLFVGIDLHKLNWQVCIRTCELELKSASIPGKWEALKAFLLPFKESNQLQAVYEAGFLGFWLYHRLADWGVECTVVAPTLIPRLAGNRIKTDRRDAAKLADFLSRGLLRSVHVPCEQEEARRELIRARNGLSKERMRVKLKVKSFLLRYGLTLQAGPNWGQKMLRELRSMPLPWREQRISLDLLLGQIEFFTQQIHQLDQELERLAQEADLALSFQILTSLPGVGLLTALEFLLELGDLRRFADGEKLTAYLGLTPSQFSSGQHVRMGKIVRTSKQGLRTKLIEASWRLIVKDVEMRKVYEGIKVRRGGKRAIIAVARRLAVRMRQMLLATAPIALKAA